MSFPTNISDLYVRLDASSLSLSDGDSVSSWSNEQGSYLNFTQSSSSNQPTFVADAFDGHPAVRFDRSNDQWLRTSGDASLAGTPYTVVVAAKHSSENKQRLLRLGATTSSSAGLSFDLNTTTHFMRPVVAHNSPSNRSFGYTKKHLATIGDEPHVWSYTVPSDQEEDLRIFFDDAEVNTKAGENRDNMLVDSDAPFTLGMDYNENGGLDGDVFEVLIYRKELDRFEIDRIWRYFRDKYEFSTNPIRRVPNLMAWFDASDLNLSEGDSVSSWTDKLNQSTLTQSESSSQPVYSEKNPRQNPTVSFDSDDFLESQSGLDLDNQNFSSFVLYRPENEEVHNLFELKNNAFRFRSLHSKGYEQLQIDVNDNESRVRAEQVPVVGDTFRISGFSLHDEDEEGTSFFVNNDFFEVSDRTDSGNALPDTDNPLRVGHNFEGEITGIVVVKGRSEPTDIFKVQSEWQDSYLRVKKGSTSLTGSSELTNFFAAKTNVQGTASVTSAYSTVVGGDSPTIQASGSVTPDGGVNGVLEGDLQGQANVSAEGEDSTVEPIEGSSTLSGSSSHIQSGSDSLIASGQTSAQPNRVRPSLKVYLQARNKLRAYSEVIFGDDTTLSGSSNVTASGTVE